MERGWNLGNEARLPEGMRRKQAVSGMMGRELGPV